MNANLREQLRELRLSGLSQSLEVRLQEARSSRLDYAEFLELILEDEMMTRRDRQIDRRADRRVVVLVRGDMGKR